MTAMEVKTADETASAIIDVIALASFIPAKKYIAQIEYMQNLNDTGARMPDNPAISRMLFLARALVEFQSKTSASF